MRWQSVQHQMPNSGANHTDLLSEVDGEYHVEPDKTNADRYYKQKMNCAFAHSVTVHLAFSIQSRLAMLVNEMVSTVEALFSLLLAACV